MLVETLIYPKAFIVCSCVRVFTGINITLTQVLSQARNRYWLSFDDALGG
jgi:hypothetical protein